MPSRRNSRNSGLEGTMPTATHSINSSGRQDDMPVITPQDRDQEPTKGDFEQLARKVKEVFRADKYATAAVFKLRADFLTDQRAKAISDSRRAMLSRNLDLMAEYSQLVLKRMAIEHEMEDALREAKDQMDVLIQRMDAALTGLVQEAKDAGIRGLDNFSHIGIED